jgi:16S rRNA (guanine527-N7)-methyltransferase
LPGVDEGGHSPTPLNDTPLYDILAEAREAGFLGPGPLEPQVRHALGFVTVGRRLAAGGPASPRLLDLGSGGGLPGLVVADCWPEADVVLLDASGRRTAFLRRAVDRLALSSRVTVVQERAEVCGHQEGLRGAFDGVLARSFGRPAVVAECAAPLLRVQGWLVVSEPPPPSAGTDERDEGSRWPAEPLRFLGLEAVELVHKGFEYRTFRQRTTCPARFPRRNGVPAKRPLF